MGSGASARKRSRSSNSLYGIGADVSAHLRSKEAPGHNRIVWLMSEISAFSPSFDGELRRLIQNILESDSCKGGGGGNRALPTRGAGLSLEKAAPPSVSKAAPASFLRPLKVVWSM